MPTAWRHLPLHWLFGALLVVGAVAELLLKPPLYADDHALGMHTIGLLVPFVAAVVFAWGSCLLDRFPRWGAIGSPALFLLLCLPFADLLASPIVHLEGDDSYRHSVYAHNILTERTLWGSDGLLYGVRHYVDQPGFRYFAAASIGLLGGEHRGLQLFDMALLLLASLTLLRVLEPRVDRTRFLAFGFFLVGSAPYAAKNVLYGYTEWFVVMVFMLFVAQLLRGRQASAMLLLALVPFVRQNLLIVSVILAGVVVVTSGRRWLLLLYAAVLALPVVHNLYYAGELRFLVDNRGWTSGFGNHPQGDADLVRHLIWSKIPHYVGYAADQDLLTLAIALFFVPFGTALAAWQVVGTPGWRRWLFAAVAAAAIIPTMLFGGLSYPRFVYVNLSILLMTCLALGGGLPQSRVA